MASHIQRDVTDSTAGIEHRRSLGQAESFKHLLLHLAQGRRDWEWNPCVVIPDEYQYPVSAANVQPKPSSANRRGAAFQKSR